MAKREDEVGRRPACPNHVVHFYDAHDALVQGSAAFLAGGMLHGGPAIAIVAAEHADALRAKVTEMGIDVERATASRQLVLLDSAQTLDRILVGGVPDGDRFVEVIGGAVAELVEGFRPLQLHAYGDMVDLLCARGDSDAAIALEALWDDLAHRMGFALYCAYDGRHFAKPAHRPAFNAICGHHGRIVPFDRAGAPAVAEA